MTDEEKTLRKKLNLLIKSKKKLMRKYKASLWFWFVSWVVISFFLFPIFRGISIIMIAKIIIFLLVMSSVLIGEFILFDKYVFKKINKKIDKIIDKEDEISREIDKVRAKELLNNLSKSDAQKINTVLLNPDLLDTVKKVDLLLPLLSDKENAIKTIFTDDEPIIIEKKQGNEAKTYVPASNK